MPLEVTPVPFSQQQLPYAPKFVPAEIEGIPGPGGSMVAPPGGRGSVARGPASAAASAIIPPAPGGVAGPHNAIPALPDAGYTNPALRASNLPFDPNDQFQGGRTVGGFGGPESVYGGASVYNGGGVAPSAYGAQTAYQSQSLHPNGYPPNAGPQAGYGPGGPMSVVYSEAWAPTSLPAPRRAPVGLPNISPPSAFDSFYTVRPEHHQHQHHQQHHHHRSSVIDDDGMSDASYYARPKARRHKSDSFSSVSDASLPSPREGGHRRTTSMNHGAGGRASTPLAQSQSPLPPRPAVDNHHHRQRSPSLGPGNNHVHSPVSPSPLAQPIPLPRDHAQSPLSPKAVPRGRSMSVDMEIGGPQYRDTQHEKNKEKEARDKSKERARGRRLSGQRQGGKAGSLSDSESVVGIRELNIGQQRDQSSSYRRQRHHSKPLPGFEEEEDEGYMTGEDGYRRHPQSVQEERRGRHDSIRHGHNHHHHRRQGSQASQNGRKSERHHGRSHSHVPPPLRAASPTPAAAMQYPQSVNHNAPLPNPGPAPMVQSYQTPPGRRRAQSLQGMDGPGYVQMQNPYQAPSVTGYGPVDVYDDGESLAGSQMTFMDGAVGGKVSQYGLPKYPHQPKVDYRRFCVQRGNADVFLD